MVRVTVSSGSVVKQFKAGWLGSPVGQGQWFGLLFGQALWSNNSLGLG